MRIKGLKCLCNGRVNPPDHYTSGACQDHPNLPPLAWTLKVLRSQAGDDLHAHNNHTVTRLMACPRETGILDNLAVNLDVLSLNSVSIGNAIHAWCESGTEAGAYAEVRFPRPGQPPTLLFAGTDCEIEVQGKLDWLSPDCVMILDYKFHGEGSYNYKIKGVDGDLSVQFSLYKQLVEANIEGASVKRAVVAHGTLPGRKECPRCKRGGKPAWTKMEVPFWTDEMILAHKPAANKPTDAGATIREIILQRKRLKARLELLGAAPGEVEVRQAIKEETSLVGRTMFGGLKCTEYCTAREECDAMEGIV